MRFSVLTALLLSGSIASANPLLARQDTTSTSSSSSVSTTDSASTSSTVSTSSTSAASASTTAPGSTSASDTATGTSTDAPANTNYPPGTPPCTLSDAEQAHIDGQFEGPPALCGISGHNNTLFPGDNKYITWAPEAFTDRDARVYLRLEWMDNTGNVIWNADNIPASAGLQNIMVNDSFLNGQSRAQYRLILEERQPGSGGVTITGPIVIIIKPDTTPRGPPTQFNILGLAIGLPVSIFVIAVILGVMCCVNKRHGSVFSKIKLPTRRKGYGVRQSRRQRMGNATDDFDFDASAPIYRDDPAGDYAASTREERSARAMGVFSAERNLHSAH